MRGYIMNVNKFCLLLLAAGLLAPAVYPIGKKSNTSKIDRQKSHQGNKVKKILVTKKQRNKKSASSFKNKIQAQRQVLKTKKLKIGITKEKHQPKIYGYFGEQFYFFIDCLNAVRTFLRETLEEEKKLQKTNTTVPWPTLHSLLKQKSLSEYPLTEQGVEYAIKTHFSDKSIGLFKAYCEQVQESKENNELFENVVNYFLYKYESQDNFSILNELKTVFNYQHKKSPFLLENFLKKCKETDPVKRGNAYIKNQPTEKFIYGNIEQCPCLKKCLQDIIEKTGQKFSLNDIELVNTETGVILIGEQVLRFSIPMVLDNGLNDKEIFAVLLHEFTHMRNDYNSSKYAVALTNFITCSTGDSNAKKTFEKKLQNSVKNKKIVDFVQQYPNIFPYYIAKIQELLADDYAFSIAPFDLLGFSVKFFLSHREIVPGYDPLVYFTGLTFEPKHLPHKQRITFWAKKLLKKGTCPWKNRKKYTIAPYYTQASEHRLFCSIADLTDDFILHLKNRDFKWLKDLCKGTDPAKFDKLAKNEDFFKLYCKAYKNNDKKFLKLFPNKKLKKMAKKKLKEAAKKKIENT